MARRKFQVWLSRNDNNCGQVAFAQPKWCGWYWVSIGESCLCYHGLKCATFALGLPSVPPRGVAWLVEVAAPGKSRIVRKVKGGEK